MNFPSLEKAWLRSNSPTIPRCLQWAEVTQKPLVTSLVNKRQLNSFLRVFSMSFRYGIYTISSLEKKAKAKSNVHI